MTSAARLLQQIDPLPAPARERLLAETARRLAGTTDLRPLLDDLAAHGAFGSRLALRLAVVAQDAAHVERSLDAAEPSVRARAIVAAVELGLPASLLLERFPKLPAAHRATLFRALRGHASVELAEALLPVAQDRFGDREAAALLPAVGHERVAALLPDLDHAVGSWTSLGSRHPAQLLAYVESRLSTEPTALWAGTWGQVGPAVAAATPADPARVLGLLERSILHAPFPAALTTHTAMLARLDPARFLRLVTDPGRVGQVPLGRTAMKAMADLPDADLVALGRAVDETCRLAVLLHALPPSRRAVVHEGVAGTGELNRYGAHHALESIDELPAVSRHAAARRLLAERSIADDPRSRLAVTARLDWPDAEPVLRPATQQPEAQDRAHAWACLVGAAARSREPEVVTELLGSMDRVRNDQDVVRRSVLSALAAVPPWLFSDSDAAALSQMVADAAAARDASWQTMSAIRALCDRLLHTGLVDAKPALARTALDGLGVLASQSSSPTLRGVTRHLPRGAEESLVTALLPRIETDAARGDFDVALDLAFVLGRRAWDLPRLQTYVDRARGAKSDSTVRGAISLWLAPPSTRDERVALVIKADRSTVTIPAVSHAIGWRRTDLLDDVLRRSMHGRFLKRGVRFVPHFQGCFHRWLPRQVLAYSKLLGDVAGSARLPAWERTQATRTLGRIGADLPLLRSLAGDTEVSVAEAAIAGLAWADDPTDALPDLVALAQTDRARVAVPAITRAARLVLPRDLPAILRPLLVGAKITSRKEAVRLLAEQRVPGAARLLVDTFDLPDQHRDVRRAVIAAARFHLDDPETWDLLDRAISDAEVATAVLDVPVGTVARRHRPSYAALVQRVAASDDPDTARPGLAALPAWLPWCPEAVEELVATVADLTRTSGWRPALTALATGCTITGSGAPLAALAVSLAGQDDDSLDGPDRDRPALRRLDALVQSTIAAVADRHRALATEVGEGLADLHQAGAIRLLAAGLDFDDAAPLLRICVLADRPTLAVLARDSVAQAFAPVVRRRPGRATELLAELPTDDTATGLVALAIAEPAGVVEGWPSDLQAVVRSLREHPDPDLRDSALRVALAPE
ncbi:hypothetical protein [Nocardioides currus]|uniref:HEAT repeat domain-containing protein n=1 Tax=Nocardioides currus TaxID=2133958 RepID=A0A2R7YX99_9ACTN|nr:hypothetical protein [Nocardioides currus]PUA81007.1 hypothetical protein C7S10_11530 [Nocardioides currus]